VSCLADFTLGGVKLVEYQTWLSGETAYALFFAQVAAPRLGRGPLPQIAEPHGLSGTRLVQ
jgi:hypothetical protein